MPTEKLENIPVDKKSRPLAKQYSRPARGLEGGKLLKRANGDMSISPILSNFDAKYEKRCDPSVLWNSAPPRPSHYATMQGGRKCNPPENRQQRPCFSH